MDQSVSAKNMFICSVHDPSPSVPYRFLPIAHSRCIKDKEWNFKLRLICESMENSLDSYDFNWNLIGSGYKKGIRTNGIAHWTNIRIPEFQNFFETLKENCERREVRNFQ